MHQRHAHQQAGNRGSARHVALALLVIVIACFVAFMAYTRGEPAGDDGMFGSSQRDEAPRGDTQAPPATTDAASDQPITPTPVTIQLNAEQEQVLAYISEGRFMEARAAVALYQEHRPACATCEFLHGLSYHKEKRYELARPFFEKAIEMEPRYAPTWYFYGWCLYYLGELDDARAAFEHHLTLNPLAGDSHFGLGLIAMDEGELEKAETRFQEAIELQEQNPRRVREVAKAHARLGDVYMLQDKLQEAKTQLYLATELWPGHYEAQFKLARVLYRLGEDEAAGAAMRKFEQAQEVRQGLAPTLDGESEEAPSEEEQDRDEREVTP